MTITFRPGETEAMGVIEPVDYETKGNAVKVTYPLCQDRCRVT